jgi:hypothetical protein
MVTIIELMRARVEDHILFIHFEDVPQYKKNGSIVRNSYFWALRSIAVHTQRSQNWEYDDEVWSALQRMLLSFSAAGYLSLQETQLEFPAGVEIPALLRPVSTWI